MIKIATVDGVYKLRFYHKHKKKTGKLLATCAVLEFPSGLERAATVKPQPGEKTISRAFGRFYAVQRLIKEQVDPATGHQISRTLRVALGAAVPFPG